jgi:hypothetical protein
VKLVSIERQDAFCYAAVSRGGRVGIYSGDLRLETTYEVSENLEVFFASELRISNKYGSVTAMKQ